MASSTILTTSSVAFADFLILSANFGSATPDPPGVAGGDLDGDGTVGFPDFLILSDNFGASAATTAVPEPTGVTLLFVGVMLLGLARRRR